jgi:hypothetical protein
MRVRPRIPATARDIMAKGSAPGEEEDMAAAVACAICRRPRVDFCFT